MRKNGNTTGFLTHHHVSVVVVLCMGVMFSGAMFDIVLDQERNLIQAEFEWRASNYVDPISWTGLDKIKRGSRRSCVGYHCSAW